MVIVLCLFSDEGEYLFSDEGWCRYGVMWSLSRVCLAMRVSVCLARRVGVCLAMRVGVGIIWSEVMWLLSRVCLAMRVNVCLAWVLVWSDVVIVKCLFSDEGGCRYGVK